MGKRLRPGAPDAAGVEAGPQGKSVASDKTRRLPPYNVVLLNDDDHTDVYVFEMLGSLFGYAITRAYDLTEELERTGRAVVFTTHKEHAELKRDQILAFGPDRRIQDCLGSMSATIEPAVH